MISAACFVTAHGFGHASRMAAVVQALADRHTAIKLSIFTTVPRWFFEESLAVPFEHHQVETDVGLVQRTALEEDLEATLQRLDAFLPLREEAVSQCAAALEASGCDIVLSDISPLGLAAARIAGVPSALIESFTWGWIYARYLDSCPALGPHIETLEQCYALATLHLRALPACDRRPGPIEIAPISRRPRTSAERVRQLIGVPTGHPLVLVTMGGVPWRHASLAALANHDDAFFVVPGASDTPTRRPTLLTIPHRSDHYHPDLVNAADLVVGKIGYSTLAETLASGAGFLAVPRPHFPESSLLADYARSTMRAQMITQAELECHGWLDRIASMSAPADRPRYPSAGADQAASAILGLLRGSTTGAGL